MRRVVLLSGGLDSVAALHWAKGRGPEMIDAIGFDYGQPHRDAELFAAGTIAARRGACWWRVLLPELPRLNPEAGRDEVGISRAFVPGRNALFLARAACFARAGEDLGIVMGCNADDFAAFPDCRGSFFDAARGMLSAALVGVSRVSILTPWLSCSKAEILRWCRDRPEALEDARDSVSCYRGTRCGACDACALRARAFAEVAIEDGTSLPRSFGGDPAREARLRR